MSMYICRSKAVRRLAFFALLVCVASVPGFGQQVLQRGALGTPAQVFDETLRWTTPILVASDPGIEVYIPDVSTASWLERNYADFENKGQYVISLFTRYRTPRACRSDLVRWGFADAAHLDACVDIGYRVRQVSVDTHEKTVTLLTAAMIGQDGQLLLDATQPPSTTRPWMDLDATAQTALGKTTSIVAEQMRIYDRRIRGVH